MAMDSSDIRRKLALRIKEAEALRAEVLERAGRRTAPAMEIAIVGMSCRFPGGTGPEPYFRSLLAGADLFGPLPRERWPWSPDDGIKVPRMGTIDDALSFDCKLFSISPREAEAMDPHHRLLLEQVWLALQDAGYRGKDFSRRKTGVFVALYNQDFTHYARWGNWDDISRIYLATGDAHCLLPNRISYLFDLRGPSEIVNTACSSALTALHRAAEAIRCGECAQAVVGGVSLLLEPSRLVALQRLGLLSPNGICAPFDADSGGQVMGEGVGAVILKPLADALRDRDNIHAVLHASGVNHQGARSGSLTLPSVEAQAELIREVLAQAGLPAAAVSYVEAHGNGSAGDGVELQAFAQAYGEGIQVGSVKGNIGFLEAAGGLSQLVKVVLAMKSGIMPGTRMRRQLPDESGQPSGGCRLISRNTPLSDLTRPSQQPFIAAVHAYGLGGANAHLLLSPPPSQSAAAMPGRAMPIMLSGQNREELRRNAIALTDWLGDRSPFLADVAFTLAVGRDPCETRGGFMARSMQDVLDGLASCDSPAPLPDGDEPGTALLRHWLAGEAAPDDLVSCVFTEGRRASLPPPPLQRRTFPLPSLTGPLPPPILPAPPPAEPAADLGHLICLWVAEQTGLPAGEIGQDVPLTQFGFDSIGLVAVCERAKRELALELSASDVGRDATARHLAQRLRTAAHGGANPPRSQAADAEIMARLPPPAAALDMALITSLERREEHFRQQRMELQQHLSPVADAELARAAERHGALFDLSADDRKGLWLFVHTNEGNSFDLAALRGLLDLLLAIGVHSQRHELAALYISHHGRNFSLGGHRESFAAAAAAGEWGTISEVGDVYKSLLSALDALPCPTVAAAYGSAQGGGLELMMATDHQIVWPGVKVGFPEIKSGLLAGMGGISYVMSVAGPQRALRLNMTGELIASEDAVALGLLSQVSSRPFADARALVAAIPDRQAARRMRAIVNAWKYKLLRQDIDCWVEAVSDGGFLAFAEKIRKDFQIIRGGNGVSP